jgi:hypothetical protein
MKSFNTLSELYQDQNFLNNTWCKIIKDTITNLYILEIKNYGCALTHQELIRINVNY